jgi:hypothetical protein
MTTASISLQLIENTPNMSDGRMIVMIVMINQHTHTQHTWNENPGGCKPFILKVAQVEMEGMREPHETLAGTAGDSDNQNVPPSTLSTFAVSKKMAQCSSPGSAGPFLETPNCW